VDLRFACLMYHNVEDQPNNCYSIPPENFRNQIKVMLDQGFTIEGFAGLSERISTGLWPEKYILISFDDGHRSFMNAAAILSSFGIRGSFFLTKDLCINQPDFLDSNEIRELATMAELGTHGVTHSPFTRLTPDEALKELAESKDWLQQCTGNLVQYMTAPGGFWNARLQKMAVSTGYSLVGTSEEWWNSLGSLEKTRAVARVAYRKQYNERHIDEIINVKATFFIKRFVRIKLIFIPKAILTMARYHH